MSSPTLQKLEGSYRSSRFLCRPNGSIRLMRISVLSPPDLDPINFEVVSSELLKMIGNYSVFFSAHLGALMSAFRLGYCLVNTERISKRISLISRNKNSFDATVIMYRVAQSSRLVKDEHLWQRETNLKDAASDWASEAGRMSRPVQNGLNRLQKFAFHFNGRHCMYKTQNENRMSEWARRKRVYRMQRNFRAEWSGLDVAIGRLPQSEQLFPRTESLLLWNSSASLSQRNHCKVESVQKCVKGFH